MQLADLLKKVIPLVLVVSLGLYAGYMGESMSIKTVMLPLAAIVGLTILFVPYRYSIMILFIYLPFEGMLKIFSGYNPIVHVAIDLFIVALIAKWAVPNLVKGKNIFKEHPPLTALFAIHIIWFFVQFLNPDSVTILASAAAGKVYVTTLAMFFFGFYVPRNFKDVKLYMSVWVASAFLQAILAFIQMRIGPEGMLALSGNYAGPIRQTILGGFRPFGTGPSGGYPAIIIFLATPFIIYFISRARSKMIRILLTVSVPVLILTMFYCQIRSLFVQVVITVFLTVVFTFTKVARRLDRVKIMFISGALIASMWVAVPMVTGYFMQELGTDDYFLRRFATVLDEKTLKNARGNQFELIWDTARQYPWGVGMSRIGPASGVFKKEIEATGKHTMLFADNFWVLTIYDLGVVGSLILTALLVAVFIRGWNTVNGLKNIALRFWGFCFLAAYVAIFVGLYGAAGVVYQPSASYFWFFSGVLLALPRLEKAIPGKRVF